MHILAFSDFHGSLKAARKASQLIHKEQPDLVIVAGDLVQGSHEMAEHFLQILSEPRIKVFFVPGNVDNPALANWTGTDMVSGLHGKSVTFCDVTFVGLGGAPESIFAAPFEYNEAKADRLLRLALSENYQRWVLLSHSPPINTKVDVTWGGDHAGSTAVRRIIEERNPVLAVCGHIHEAKGIDEVHGVPVVNVGPAIHDSYAILTINRHVQIEQKSTMII